MTIYPGNSSCKFTASKVSYLRIDYTRILRTLHTESTLISMAKSLELNLKWTLQFKGAQVWDFWLIFFTPINPKWVSDLRTGEKKYFVRRLRQIFAILFFYAGWVCVKKMPTQAEPALKNVYAGWVFAKKMPTQAEPLLKKTVKTGGKFTHTEPALTICLRRLGLR